MKKMKHEEYRSIIEKLGLTQVAAGEFLDIGERTSRRYALGESPIPGPVAILLRNIIKQKLAPEAVSKYAMERVL